MIRDFPSIIFFAFSIHSIHKFFYFPKKEKPHRHFDSDLSSRSNLTLIEWQKWITKLAHRQVSKLCFWDCRFGLVFQTSDKKSSLFVNNSIVVWFKGLRTHLEPNLNFLTLQILTIKSSKYLDFFQVLIFFKNTFGGISSHGYLG